MSDTDQVLQQDVLDAAIADATANSVVADGDTPPGFSDEVRNEIERRASELANERAADIAKRAIDKRLSREPRKGRKQRAASKRNGAADLIPDEDEVVEASEPSRSEFRSFDRAMAKLDLNDRVYGQMEEWFVRDRPENVNNWIEETANAFGWKSQPKPEEGTQATTPQTTTSTTAASAELVSNSGTPSTSKTWKDIANPNDFTADHVAAIKRELGEHKGNAYIRTVVETFMKGRPVRV